MDSKYISESLLHSGKALGECVYPADFSDSEDYRREYESLALLPQQTHSINVGIAEMRDQSFAETDALVTFTPGLPIGVVTADCVPILIYAPDVSGVAAVHAGWRGTLGGIIDKTVILLENHGAAAENMEIAFGPSISKEMYEVDEDLADMFRDAGYGKYISYPSGEGSKPHIDLQGVNVERLLQHGVKPEKIRTNPHCSFSSLNSEGLPLYQSYRRSHGNCGRNLTKITLR